MKIIMISLITAATINAAAPQGDTNMATGGLGAVAPMVFSCLCAGQLQNAFQTIKTHVVSQNLSPIKTSLENLNKNVQNNIKALEAQEPLAQKSNDIYIEKIIEAKKILFKLEQQTKEQSSGKN